jgi:hypothetical protein
MHIEFTILLGRFQNASKVCRCNCGYRTTILSDGKNLHSSSSSDFSPDPEYLIEFPKVIKL